MTKDEFKDRLFDILNETDALPIQDISLEDKKDTLNIYLADGSRFSIYVKNSGFWYVYEI